MTPEQTVASREPVLRPWLPWVCYPAAFIAVLSWILVAVEVSDVADPAVPVVFEVTLNWLSLAAMLVLPTVAVPVFMQPRSYALKTATILGLLASAASAWFLWTYLFG